MERAYELVPRKWPFTSGIEAVKDVLAFTFLRRDWVGVSWLAFLLLLSSACSLTSFILALFFLLMRIEDPHPPLRKNSIVRSSSVSIQDRRLKARERKEFSFTRDWFWFNCSQFCPVSCKKFELWYSMHQLCKLLYLIKWYSLMHSQNRSKGCFTSCEADSRTRKEER